MLLIGAQRQKTSCVLKSGHNALSPRWGQSRRLPGGGHFKLNSKGKREQTMGAVFPNNARARLTTQRKKQKSRVPGQESDSLADTRNPSIRVMRSPLDRSSRLTGSPQAPKSFPLPAAPFRLASSQPTAHLDLQHLLTPLQLCSLNACVPLNQMVISSRARMLLFADIFLPFPDTW